MKTSFKSLFLVLASVVLLFTSALAQETVQVDVTKLSESELRLYQSLKQKQLEAANQITIANASPEKLEKYMQIGKSFGVAFKECWSTVSTDAERFAQSDAGKLTMFLIAWKIVGQDGVNLLEKGIQYSIGIPLLLVGTIFFFYIFRRNCIEQPLLVSRTKIGWFTVKSEYKGMDSAPHGSDGYPILYGIAYAIFIGICCLIIFTN